MATSRRTAFPDRPILGLPAISAITGPHNKKEAGPASFSLGNNLSSEFNIFCLKFDEAGGA
jgi:hypothetical protein